MVVKHLEINKIDVYDSELPVFLITNTYSGWHIRFGIYETKYLLQALHEQELAEALQPKLEDELPDSIKKQLDHKFEEWGFLHSQSNYIDTVQERALAIYQRMKLFLRK